ncbi:MAG: aminotransferase class I/II-fold pyridoxal phosphate-dependent enzyme [Candidatus Omnitrophota bacterium]
MRAEFLPFSKPSINQEDINAITDVLRSGWITTGAKNTEFENKFCVYTKSKGAVALTSATAGMQLMLKALGIGPGDEVITPSMTWVSTVNLIVLSGAKPVFADIDKNTLMVSAQSIKSRLSTRTKLIIPVHFSGAAADMDPIRALAGEHGLDIIEDSAHALGTQYKGKFIGEESTAIFSFHPIKNITTAEGGMVCSDNIELLEKIRRLKFHGLGVDAYNRENQGRAPQAQVIEPGFKFNLPDILAALGISQLLRLNEFNKKRTELAGYYLKRLAEIEEISPLALPAYPMKHSRHLFIVRLDIDKAGLSRNMFMEELKKRNIGTGLHFQAVHLHDYYQRSWPQKAGLLPNTEWNSERIFSLPLFPMMNLEDVDDVIESIKDVLANCRDKR